MCEPKFYLGEEIYELIKEDRSGVRVLPEIRILGWVMSWHKEGSLFVYKIRRLNGALVERVESLLHSSKESL